MLAIFDSLDPDLDYSYENLSGYRNIGWQKQNTTPR